MIWRRSRLKIYVTLRYFWLLKCGEGRLMAVKVMEDRGMKRRRMEDTGGERQLICFHVVGC